MNLLGEYILELKNSKKLLKLTNKALYQTQVDLNKKGLLDIIQALDTMDLMVIYKLASNCAVNKDLSVEQLLEEDINLVELAQYLAQQIAILFTGKKLTPVLETKSL